MSYLITAIAFLVIFTLLVLIHEWGHYKMAKKAKIKVEEFGFGLPPKMLTMFRKDGTDFTLNWIPFGGFVRMYGEDDFSEKAQKDKDSFQSKTLWQRTAVIIAGVVMNYLLAFVLLAIGFTFGMAPILVSSDDIQKAIDEGILVVEESAVIADIVDGSPAASSELKAGDKIIQINGLRIEETQDILDVQAESDIATYLVERGEETVTAQVQPDAEGKIGIVIATQQTPLEVKKVRYPIHQAVAKSFYETGRLSWLTVGMLGNVVTSLVQKAEVPEGVAGPVGILQLTHHYAQEGFMALLQLCAVLSLSLAVINIMPFPALDGGRLLFIIYEAVTRKKVNRKAEGYIHAVGFILLLLLIFAVTWKDIARIFGG